MAIRVNSEAVGVAGLSKEADTEIASTAAAALSPPQLSVGDELLLARLLIWQCLEGGGLPLCGPSGLRWPLQI
jgi:hypothetical protein